MIRARLIAMAVAAALFVGACSSTSYGPFLEDAAAPAPLERRVAYELDDAYYSERFSCVAIIAVAGQPFGELALEIETSLARHASTYFGSVIGAAETRRLERSLGLTLDDPGDRRWFARRKKCELLLAWRAVDVSSTNALVWSEQRLGLELELIRARDGKILWHARHVTRRSDGGLPLSLFSAPITAFEAARFSEDTDVVPSMIDDVLRRTFVTLPVLR